MDKCIRVVHGIYKNSLQKKGTLLSATVFYFVLNSAVGPNFVTVFMENPVKYLIVL
jgi:hypothetical protein